MSSNAPESSSTPPAGNLQSMLARLRGMIHATKAPDDAGKPAETPVMAVTSAPAPVVSAPPPAAPMAAAPEPPPAAAEAPRPTGPTICPVCATIRQGMQEYCADCGYCFSADSGTGGMAAAPPSVLKDRYHIQAMVSERGGVSRYRAQDMSSGTAVPVIIVRAASLGTAEPIAEEVTDADEDGNGDLLPDFEMPAAEAGGMAWPSIAWERELLEKAGGPGFPRIIDSFTEDGAEYLVEEEAQGQTLWDAWDDPDATYEQKFGYLKSLAEVLHRLHKAGAIVESMRPGIVTITAEGQAVLNDLGEVLPIPIPPNTAIRATLYTAPEVILTPDKADARADLYGFGAMLFSLHVGRELIEKDFEKQQGVPKAFIPQFPDEHPLFSRLMVKTFFRDLAGRFPTDEAAKEEATGFNELIRTLDVCGRTLGKVRMEIAAWTTTGIVRTGNEDACALLHAVETRQDDLHEYALILLADGMGGYEAGEIASALAIQTLRKNLLQQKIFSALAGDTPPQAGAFSIEECKKAILAALKDANRTVNQAPKNGIGRRGMGCTAEVVYVDGQHVVVGHVGDSRTYHLHQGHMVQMTRDQTFVNRMVELGQMTPEEAETHPRRSELQQAIGGRADVDPELYHGKMKAGDWVLVCSDGLTNHIKNEELHEMLKGEAYSAETAARRLVNLVNLRGATDNATVVVVRGT